MPAAPKNKRNAQKPQAAPPGSFFKKCPLDVENLSSSNGVETLAVASICIVMLVADRRFPDSCMPSQIQEYASPAVATKVIIQREKKES